MYLELGVLWLVNICVNVCTFLQPKRLECVGTVSLGLLQFTIGGSDRYFGLDRPMTTNSGAKLNLVV